jgi:hypothetical protein
VGITTGKPATSVGVDATPPTLASYDLNLNSGTLVLTFSEPVDPATIVPSGFTLADDSPSTVTLPLTGGTPSSTLSTVVTLTLTSTDLNQLKIMPGVTPGYTASYLHIAANSIKDTAVIGNFNDEVALLAAGSVTADSTEPTLESFTLNLETNVLLLTFSEIIPQASVNPQEVTIQSKAVVDGSTVSVTLSGGTVGSTSHIISITVPDSDMELIKNPPTLGSSTSNTFMSITQDLATDANIVTPNKVTAKTLAASSVFPRTTNPQLQSFGLNMRDGTLSLLFSVYIDPTSINLAKLSLQTAASSPAFAFPLTGATVTTNVLSRTMVITLTVDQLNAIKTHRDLAVSEATSFLAATSGAASDVFSLPSDAVTHQCLAGSFTADDIRPNFVGFDLSLDGASSLTIRFDETMDKSTITRTSLIFQDAALSSNQHQLAAAGTLVTTVDGTSFVITLAKTDLDALKAKLICTAKATCYLRLLSSAAKDMQALDVHELADGSAIQATGFSLDTTAPALVEFVNFNLNTGVITLSFSEPVDPASVSYVAMTLSNAASTPDVSLTLTGGSTTSTASSTFAFTVDNADLTAIKLSTTALCRSSVGNDCYLKLDSTFIADTSGIDMAAVGEEEFLPLRRNRAKTINADTTGPILQSFSINMNSAQLTLTFDEPILPLFLAATAITLKDAVSSHVNSYTLTTGTILTTTTGTTVTLQLLAVDINRIKALRTLAISQASSVMTVTTSLIVDYRNNVNSAVSDLVASAFVADSTSPTLISFDMININAGTLQLSFSEPVDTDTISYTQITLAKTAGGASPLSLSGGTVAYVDSSTKLQIVVTMTSSDLRAVKLVSGLAVGISSSFISLSGTMIKDMATRSLTATSGRQAAAYVTAAQPSVSSFTLDMDTGKLALSFSDVMLTSSLVYTAFTLQSTSSNSMGTKRVTLTGGSTTSSDGFELVIDITTADLNNIKAQRTLAVDRDSTYLVLTSDGVANYASTPVLSIISTNALKAATHTPDATSPVLSSFTYSLATGTLSLTFSETVDFQTLTKSELIFQNAASQTAMYALTAASIVGTATEGTTLDLLLTSTQLSALDLLNVAQTTGTTWLTFSADAIKDMALVANKITAAVDGVSAKQASAVTPSSVGPSMVSFELDMDGAGKLKMVFSKTVVANMLVYTSITLENAVPSDSYTLTGGDSPTQVDEVTVEFTLLHADMNAIKKKTTLATETSNTYLRALAGTIKDRASNNMLARTALIAGGYTPDTTSPELDAFELNM